jgi:hypothetical protein
MADIRRAEEGGVFNMGRERVQAQDQDIRGRQQGGVANEGQVEEEDEDDDDQDDNESNDPPLPSWLAEDVEYWHRWYVAIVHKSANVAVRRPFRYTEGYAKPASSSSSSSANRPFPFNLDAHWYCAFLLLSVIAVHIGVFETGWLLENDRAHWLGRVLGRSFLTLGIAMASTVTFELGGQYTGRKIEVFRQKSRKFVARVWFMIFLRWGEADEEGHPILDNDEEEGVQFAWLRVEAVRSAPIREFFCGVVVVYVVDYCLMLSSALGVRFLVLFAENVLVPGLEFFFAVPGDFLVALPAWFALPTPGLGFWTETRNLDLSGTTQIQILRTLWFEHGVPIVVQFSLIIFLWLLWLLFLAQAERWALYGWRVEDPKMALIAHLVRATSMHLIAYTAYQMVCGIVVTLKIFTIMSPLPLQPHWYYYYNTNTDITLVIDGPVFPLLSKIVPQGKVLAAALLLFLHWLLRASCRFLVLNFAEPLFTPYLVWCTRFTKEGARSMWPALTHPLTREMDVLDPRKRVVSRVVMTALFGLDSSWPARYHLSNIIPDD